MAYAIDWASKRLLSEGGAHLIVNAGYNDWNYRIFELGDVIKQSLPNIKVEVANKVQSDERSYRVNFDRYKKLSKTKSSQSNINNVILELWEGLKIINFKDKI